MCILFFVANPNPPTDGYRLILINNRDEDYRRPTKEAHFWDKNPDNIGGLDMEPGKEEGTWLGMSKTGKIGVLLNVLQPVGAAAADKLGRGCLVSNFLNGEENGTSYLKNLQVVGQSYNTFNIVTIEISVENHEEIHIGHYTNNANLLPNFLKPGEHAFGNSETDRPWRKVTYGRKKFSEIIAKHTTTQTKASLMDDLLKMLNDDTSLHPDAQILIQGEGRSDEVLQGLSSLHVKLPAINYGTRTNTIILVDNLNSVTYLERTMKEPINATNPEWVTSIHTFELKR